MAPMKYLWAWGTLIHEKNLKSKISCQTPFKDNEMPCISVSKLSQKQKVVSKFEYEHFKLIFVRSKIMYLRICGSFKSAIVGPINRKSANSKKYMVRKSQILKLLHLRKVRK
jgi:hypothetical protein